MNGYYFEIGSFKFKLVTFYTYELTISSFNSTDQFNGPRDIVKRKSQTDRR